MIRPSPRPSARKLADALVNLLEEEERARTVGHRWKADLCARQALRASTELAAMVIDQVVPDHDRQASWGLHKNVGRIQ